MATLIEYYGFNSDTLKECELLEGEEGYWAVSPKVITLPLRKLKTDTIGLLIVRGKRSNVIPTIAALQLFARPKAGMLNLSRKDAMSFIDRKMVAVEWGDGLYVVFCEDHAVDVGRVKNGRLVRVELRKLTEK